MHYSQNNEQHIIQKFFGSHTGLFLDIGANDGKTFSNTYALSESGWMGTLVEASPKAFSRLKSLYTGWEGIDCIEAAVGPRNGSLIFHESGQLLGTGDVALVSSSKPEELARWKNLNMKFEPLMVRMIDFDTLLDESIWGQFDLISIDIEGMEAEVVPQIPFRSLGVKMAIIEFNGKNQTFFDTIMHRQGYGIHARNAENLIYT